MREGGRIPRLFIPVENRDLWASRQTRSVCRRRRFHSNLPCKWCEGRDPENTLLDSTDLGEYTSAGLFPRWMTKPFLSWGSFLLTGVTVNCCSSTFCGSFVLKHWALGFILQKHLLLLTKQTSLHCLSGPDTSSPSSSPHQRRQGQFPFPYQSLCCLLLPLVYFPILVIPLEATENGQGKPPFKL